MRPFVKIVCARLEPQFSCLKWIPVTSLIVLLSSVPVASAGSQTTGGWEALWANHVKVARQLFQSALDLDQNDIWARRGLVIASVAGGDERVAIQELIGISSMEKADASDFLLAMWVYNRVATSAEDDKEFLKICERLSTRNSIDALDRRPILEAVIEFALSRGDVSKAKLAAERLNRIKSWSILGPFDNTSGSGHSKDHLQASNAWHPHALFTGKAGQKFNWHNPQLLSRGGALYFGNHFQIGTAITAYAGCGIEVKDTGPYLLSVCNTGAVRLKLDEEEILNSGEVGRQREYYHFEIRFNPGRHNLLVKISGAETPPTLAVSLSSIDGKQPGNVSFSPLIPIKDPAGVVSVHPRTLPLVERTTSIMAADTLNPMKAYVYLLKLWYFDLKEEIREFATIASRRVPNSAVMHDAVAVALLAAGDETGARQHMLQAIRLGPDHGPVIMWQATDKMRRRMYSQSDSLLTAAIESSPGFVTARLLLLQSYSDRGLDSKSYPMAQNLHEKYPGFSTPMEVLAKHYEALGDKAKAKRYRRAALNAMSKNQMTLEKIVRALKKDDPGEAAKQFATLLKVYPDSPLFLVNLAYLKVRDGKPEGIELADEAAAYFPYSSEAQLLKAEIDHLRSAHDPQRKDVALKFYNRALELNPGNFEIRDKLRELQGLRPISDILPPIDLEGARQQEPSASDYPGAEACVLVDEYRRIMFDDGTNYMERALLVKVFNGLGVERFSSLQTRLNPLFSKLTIKSARTIKADGREFEAKIILGEVAFESLAPGDMVELYYGGSTWTLGKLNMEFWDSHLFQWDVPCKLSRYTILVPANRSFRWKLHHTDSEENIAEKPRKIADFICNTWTMRDIPARPRESYAPSEYDVSPWLDISTIARWSDIVGWYRELSDVPSTADSRVRRKTEELLRGVTEEREKIRRLYNFVANEITYENLLFQYSAFIPESAADVLRSKYGDCKDKVCLLRSMLDAIGIESYFALVSPVEDGVATKLPSPRFNHAILAIPLGDSYSFADPTAEGMDIDHLPLSLQGANALVIKPGTADLIALPIEFPKDKATEIETEVTVKENNQYVLRRRECVRIGDKVAELRNNLLHVDQKERERFLVSDLTAKIVGVRLVSSEWHGLDFGSDSVDVRYTIEIDNGLTQSGQLSIAKLPWRSEIDRYFGKLVAAAKRQQALALHGLKVKEHESLMFKPPSGWKVMSVPESKEFSCPYGYSVFTYERSGLAIRLKRKLVIQGVVVPPEHYLSFKEFLENVIREHEAVIVLQR